MSAIGLQSCNYRDSYDPLRGSVESIEDRFSSYRVKLRKWQGEETDLNEDRGTIRSEIESIRDAFANFKEEWPITLDEESDEFDDLDRLNRRIINVSVAFTKLDTVPSIASSILKKSEREGFYSKITIGLVCIGILGVTMFLVIQNPK
jgi:hypothetical protein